jgi:hypothetical protein
MEQRRGTKRPSWFWASAKEQNQEKRKRKKNNRDRQLDLTGQVSDPNFHISKSPFGWIKAQSKELLLFRSIFFKAP